MLGRLLGFTHFNPPIRTSRQLLSAGHSSLLLLPRSRLDPAYILSEWIFPEVNTSGGRLNSDDESDHRAFLERVL